MNRTTEKRLSSEEENRKSRLVHLFASIAITLLFVVLNCSGEPGDSIYNESQSKWDLTEDQEVVIADTTGFGSSIRFTNRSVFNAPDSLYIGEITSLAVNSQDNLIIADDTNGRLHVFDSGGQHAQVLGRRGSGPREFQSITGIGVYENELFIMDPAQQRISIYSVSEQADSEYDYLKMVQISREVTQSAGLFAVLFYVIHADEWLIGASDSFSNASDSNSRKVHYYSLGRNGEIRHKRIFTHRAAEYLSVGSAEHPTIFSFSHLGKPLFSVSERYLISAWSEEPIIYLFDHKGDVIRSVFLPVSRQSMSADDIPELVGHDLEPFVAQARERVLRDHELPDTWPALNNLIVVDENRLWVSTIVEDFDVYEWWVLEETGELITKFKWPRDEPIEVVKNGMLYTRQTDKVTGLQQVVRYRYEI